MTRDDQLLADVAREVEVDVGDGVELAVEEAAEREAGRDRVDVREPGQVADERADASCRARVPAAATCRGEPGPRTSSATVARELEHLPVQQEEPGEPELVDQRQLLVESRARALLVTVRAA